jgi:hypothetical protein
MMPSYLDDPAAIRKKKPTHLFLAEGNSEVGLLESLLSIEGADPSTCSIYCFGGLSRLGTQAKQVFNVLSIDGGLSRVVSIGLLADAEQDRQSRIISVISAAIAFGFTGANTTLRHENDLSEGGRFFSFFLSPAVSENGRIEDLVLREIRTEPLFDCIRSQMSCIESLTGSAIDSKALVQIFISLKHNSSICGIKSAFAARVLDAEADAYDPVRRFVRKSLETRS